MRAFTVRPACAAPQAFYTDQCDAKFVAKRRKELREQRGSTSKAGKYFLF